MTLESIGAKRRGLRCFADRMGHERRRRRSLISSVWKRCKEGEVWEM